MFNLEFDIIAISETWFSFEKNENEFINIDGYYSYHSCRDTNTHGGGVSVYINDKLKSNLKVNINSMAFNILIIKFLKSQLSITVCYRQPNNNNLQEFFEILDDLFEKYTKNIFMGDVNINLLNDNHINTIRYVTTIRSNGFHILNKCSSDMVTRSASNSIIDHFLSDILDKKMKLSILPCSLTDHNAMILSCNIILDKKILPYEKKKINHHGLILSICESNFDNASSYSDFNNIFKENIMLNTKVLKARKKKQIIRKPYITNEIRDLCNEKEKLNNLLRNGVNISDLKKNRYKILRNMIPNKIRSAKKKYYSEQLNLNVDNPKQVWSIINEVVYNKKPKNKNEEISIIKHNNNIISDTMMIANHFNEYFIGIGKNLIENIKLKNLPIVTPTTRILNHLNEPFTIREVTENGLKILIHELKNNTSSGYDLVSSIILKDTHLKIIPSLTEIINNDLKNGIFPDILKIARVVPVYKNGDKFEMNNYRAISVLPNPSKLYEKIIYKQLNEYLIQSNFYHERQYGFVNKSNTTAACINLITEIQISLDKRKMTGCLFIDFSKAFDSVDHTKLLYKINCLNIDENMKKLMESYLTNRKQFTNINNVASNMEIINCGVPQGSILGPLFFNIFINDIFDVQLNGKLQLYADDVTVFYSTDSVDNLLNFIQQDITALSKYADDNYLTINLKKTNYIIFNKQENLNLEIKMDNIVIENLNVVKYLGLFINEKLDWTHHIKHVRKKILPITGVLRRLSNIIPTFVLKNLYFSMIHSHLSYMNMIWNSINQTDIKDLRIIQNKAIKNVYQLPRLTPTRYLYSKNILPIELLMNYNTLILIHQIKSNNIKHSFTIVENNEIHEHYTRTNNDLVVSDVRTRFGRSSILFNGFILYNNLPLEIRNITSFHKFQNIVKIHLFNNSNYINFF